MRNPPKIEWKETHSIVNLVNLRFHHGGKYEMICLFVCFWLISPFFFFYFIFPILQFDPRALLSSGNAKNQIMKAMENLDVDNVVVRQYPRNFLTRILGITSFSDYVVNRCPCPVTLVKKNREFFRRKNITI